MGIWHKKCIQFNKLLNKDWDTQATTNSTFEVLIRSPNIQVQFQQVFVAMTQKKTQFAAEASIIHYSVSLFGSHNERNVTSSAQAFPSHINQ